MQSPRFVYAILSFSVSLDAAVALHILNVMALWRMLPLVKHREIHLCECLVGFCGSQTAQRVSKKPIVL